MRIRGLLLQSLWGSSGARLLWVLEKVTLLVMASVLYSRTFVTEEKVRLRRGLAVTPDLEVSPEWVRGSHVRVIIRVSDRQPELTRSLIWSFRGQARYATSRGLPTSVDFLLIPTEPEGVSVAQHLEADFAEDGDVAMVDMPPSFWVDAVRRSRAFACSAQQRAALQSDAQHKICDYNNHLYYQATDLGVNQTLSACRWCTHMVVTNSDNGYEPTFLYWTLSYNKELVATDFNHHQLGMQGDWRRGWMDLGCMLIARGLMARVGGFIASLAPDARDASGVHDADWHFAKRALELNATHAIHHKLLFYHH